MGKLKFKVTEGGVSGIAKGEIVDIDGDKIPAWLANKGHEVNAGKTPVTNPAKGAMAPPPAPAPKK